MERTGAVEPNLVVGERRDGEVNGANKDGELFGFGEEASTPICLLEPTSGPCTTLSIQRYIMPLLYKKKNKLRA